MFEPFFNSCVWVPQLKRWISKSYSSNMQKMLETWRFRRTWRIILKNSSQFNCSEQTRDSSTKITKQKRSFSRRSFRLPQTILKTKGSYSFEGGSSNNFSCFCVNIFYVKYLTQDYSGHYSIKNNMHFVWSLLFIIMPLYRGLVL